MTSTDAQSFGEKLQKPGLNFSSRSTDEEFYDLNYPRKGFLAIFNHYKFQEHQNLKHRDGTDKDLSRLKETFGALNYEIEDFTDLTSQAMRETLTERELFPSNYFHT